jgi:hypothetical protein
MFKEKHASKCEELDVLRVEVAELKSRPALPLLALFCIEKLMRCMLTLVLLRLR